MIVYQCAMCSFPPSLELNKLLDYVAILVCDMSAALALSRDDGQDERAAHSAPCGEA